MILGQRTGWALVLGTGIVTHACNVTDSLVGWNDDTNSDASSGGSGEGADTGGVGSAASGGAPSPTGGAGGGSSGGSTAGNGAAGGITQPGIYDLGEPQALPCETGACSATFEWYPLYLEFMDLSHDGQVLILLSWDLVAGFRLEWAERRLELLDGAGYTFVPHETDFTGTTIVGSGSYGQPGLVPVQHTGLEPVSPIPGLSVGFIPWAISDDARVVAGQGQSASHTRPADGFLLQDGVTTIVEAVVFEALSADGTVAGGSRDSHATIWRDGSLFELPEVSGGRPMSVNALNADGTVAVGSAAADSDPVPFFWKDGTTTILDIPGNAALVDCDASGDVMLGYTNAGVDWFLYSETGGVVALSDVFRARGLTIPENFTFWDPRLSADGKRIAGTGTRSNGNPDEWDLLFVWYATLDP